MRFGLTLEVNKSAFGNFLPLNYQYEQSALIYRILSNADIAYSSWLHDNGFRLVNGKTFKFFTYSRFMVEKYRIHPKIERLEILSDAVNWEIGFLPEKSTRNFISGIFRNQVFEIGDSFSSVQFIVSSVETFPEPEYSEEMTFVTLSPICLKIMHQNRKTDYISPDDVRAPRILFGGLFDKYKLFYGKNCPYSFEDCSLMVLNKPKSVLTRLKTDTPAETRVRGYMCMLRVSAPKPLMYLMYEGGAGSQNSQGFGCLRII